ncbi:MAG: CARDB domain-containing protein, partial [Candidatus Saliniplasma sp.]
MLKRNIFDDEDAVSEVVGTILILSITVVLFSSIFATVSHLETPDRRTYTEMNAELINNNIRISHQGGKSIEMDRTTFFVVIDGNSDRYTYEDENLTLIDGDDDTWDIGENVEIDISELYPDNLEEPIAEILVSDNVNNQIIWDTELSLKPLIERPRIKEAGIDYKPEWRNYVERGEQVDIYAKVTHPNVTASNMPGDITVTVDLSELNGYNGSVELEHRTMNEFRKTINITSDEEEKTYHLDVRAEYNNSASKAYINLNVGPQEDVREQPNILVDDNKIYFNPSSPTSGESLRVNAVIENDGGSRALVNVTFWDERPNGDKIQAGVITNLRVAAGGGRDISATWNVNGSGEHKITVDVTDVVSPGGENYRDLDEVKGNGTVYVKPSILVVDDVPMGTREASSIRSALSGADFSFDDYQVGGPEADGPSLNDLERYDLTIWLTGGAEEYTLTDEDINTLEEYLDNGNYLWLIGENIMSDIGTTQSDFIEDYMGISNFEEDEGAPGEEYLNGTGILENITLPVNQDLDFNGDYLEPNNDAKQMMIDGLEGSNYVGITHNNSESDYRVATNSIQLQSIQSGHSTLAYRVVKWLANMEHTSGRDIAVSEQSFSTRTPMYQEEMEVSATLRNNGPVEETVDVRLYVNDRLDTSQREQVVLGPDGDSEEVSFDWTAQPVGSHDLVIKADPFDRIDETNELNNDITYTDFDTTINVQYSVLIVDADESVTDENKPNTTQFIENRIESLGYAYDYYQIEPNEDRPDSQLMSNYNSVYWVVGNSTEDEERNYPPLTGDDVENIKSYLNNETFVSFYLEGHRVIEDLRGRYNDFLENYLGVDLNSDIYKLDKVPDELHGVNEDDLSHGMDYLVEPYESINEFYGFEVGSGSPTLRDQDGNIVGSRYENEDDDFRTMFSGVGLAHIAGPNVEEEWYDDFSGPVNKTAESAREEYVYMMSKWFGNEDERVELRVSDIDIEPETEHPILGRSYLLTASIQNVGFTGSNALIRFKDGDSLIASDSIYVSGDSFHTAEVSWQPSFAGSNRPIRVLVDPMQNVAEIGNDPDDDTDHDTMGFNNHAMISQPVYYFWDDMENGTDNWNHESTIANINGEQPLGYLSEEYENVYTDIEDEWDDEMSHNVTETDQFSHSDPNSYWMAEPMAVNETVQEEVPIDVVMAIDTSGSMHWAEEQDGWDPWYPGADDPDSRMYQAVEAAIGFIEDMNEEDRLEVWTFDPYGSATPHLYLEFAEMNDGNKEDFIDDLEAIREGREGTVWEHDDSKPAPRWGPVGGTPYYDTLGYAIQSATEINE